MERMRIPAINETVAKSQRPSVMGTAGNRMGGDAIVNNVEGRREDDGICHRFEVAVVAVEGEEEVAAVVG